jgi:hypothetical protein
MDIANRTFGTVRELKYLRMTITKQNLFHAEITTRLNSVAACYRSVPNVSSSRLLSKDLKIKTFKTIISYAFLYGCESWSLILKKKHRLRVFENRMLRRIFGPKRDEITGENFTMRIFIICTLRQM